MKKGDETYRKWIQRQPSCLSGTYSEYVNGEGRCVAAHVRRASGSGTGFKGDFACVPLTQEEHLLQHQHGEESLKPKGWWDAQVEKYLTLYKKTLK